MRPTGYGMCSRRAQEGRSRCSRQRWFELDDWLDDHLAAGARRTATSDGMQLVPEISTQTEAR
jgi:hypothetical protein